jgi:hypothetical protein
MMKRIAAFQRMPLKDRSRGQKTHCYSTDHYNGAAQESAFAQADKKVERFVAQAREVSGHTLACMAGCGRCCMANTVEVRINKWMHGCMDAAH